jgi:hypothetical protein
MFEQVDLIPSSDGKVGETPTQFGLLDGDSLNRSPPPIVLSGRPYGLIPYISYRSSDLIMRLN